MEPAVAPSGALVAPRWNGRATAVHVATPNRKDPDDDTQDEPPHGGRNDSNLARYGRRRPPKRRADEQRLAFRDAREPELSNWERRRI